MANTAQTTTTAAQTPSASGSQSGTDGANSSAQSGGNSSANGTEAKSEAVTVTGDNLQVEGADKSANTAATGPEIKPEIIEAVKASNERMTDALSGNAKASDDPKTDEVKVSNEEHALVWKTAWQLCFRIPTAKLPGPYTVPVQEVTFYDQGFGIPEHLADAIGLTLDGKRTEWTEAREPEAVDTATEAK